VIAADKPPLEEVYLAHFGIKGMKWGVRKQQDSSGSSGSSGPHLTPTQHKAAKAVAIAGSVAIAAVLLHKGGVNLVDARSAKIYLSGAKMGGRILGKSGATLIKGAGKLSTKGVPAIAKGTAKIGTLAGKGAFKGTVAASKGIAQGTVKGGAQFYEKVLKKSAVSSVKLGSHAMYKFTGRGQPIVEEATKSGVLRQLNPVDLLLNTRADTLRGGRR
jgi:hypothetical protein